MDGIPNVETLTRQRVVRFQNRVYANVKAWRMIAMKDDEMKPLLLGMVEREKARWQAHDADELARIVKQASGISVQ